LIQSQHALLAAAGYFSVLTLISSVCEEHEVLCQ